MDNDKKETKKDSPKKPVEVRPTPTPKKRSDNKKPIVIPKRNKPKK